MGGNTGKLLIVNLILRPLEDVNDVTWSIVWCLLILLSGVFYVIVYILGIDERESNGSNAPRIGRSNYNFRVIEINRVLDGDTIDVTIDLGFDLYKKERVRVAGVDTPENVLETWRKRHLESTQQTTKRKIGRSVGDDDLVIRTELVGGVGKYGRLLGWLYLGDGSLSLNEQMIEEGYA